ncbi:MAG: hypothetical protein ACI8QC_001104 [Planctomycetota bacterium]|jgi:hypothetical protein
MRPGPIWPAWAKAACALLGLVACGDSNGPSGPRFSMTDVATQAGLDWSSTSGRVPSSQLLEVKGGGLAVFDADGDGRFDVFVPNGATLDDPEHGPGARLFLQRQPMAFEDATADSGIELQRWSFGCALGDVNGDGHEDLFVACFGPNVLLLGGGDGTFRDATEEAGISGSAWSSSAAFGDLDGDGDLDLYVANYVRFDPRALPAPMTFRGADVFGGPMGLPGERDQVFENLGQGRFEDATSKWGFDRVSPSYGLGVLIADLDEDGRAEVLVGNDSQANFLFTRDESGPFTDRGAQSGLALDEHGWGQATMGIALGDVNDDGRPDLFTSNFMSDHDTLHVNRGGLRFDDRSRRAGLALESMPFLGWGCGFLDLDQDGIEELLVFHGHVYPSTVTEPMGWRQDQEPQLFERTGQRWSRVANAEGGTWLSDGYRDRGAAFADMDGDGDLDVVVHELGGPLRLLRNDGAPRGAWLRVALRDQRPDASNTTGLGARVQLSAAGQVQTRWIVSGTSYQCASPAEAHFGLGAHAGTVELEVLWPDGTRQEMESVELGQRLELSHP